MHRRGLETSMDTSLQQELRDAGYTGEFELGAFIEACGDNVGIFKISATECNAWKRDFPSADPDEVPQTFNASTPEEAVARLWLALNKK